MSKSTRSKQCLKTHLRKEKSLTRSFKREKQEKINVIKATNNSNKHKKMLKIVRFVQIIYLK